MKIAVCPNPYRDHDLEITRKTVALLSPEGFESVICPIFSDSADGVLPEDLSYSRLADVAQDCSLAVVIGGDGTILTAVRSMGGSALPVLGVNLGTKGFMTALEPDELPLIVSAAKGEYTASERMLLDISLERGGKQIYRDFALNDAVIHGYGECIKITAWCSGERMTSFSGDGVIVSTPTGSTGYSMSAGGPIVEPSAKAFILSPICAHAMGAKSFVLGPERCIEILTEKSGSRRAYLSVDGNSALDIENGDILKVTKLDRSCIMINAGGKSFYENAYEKLT